MLKAQCNVCLLVIGDIPFAKSSVFLSCFLILSLSLTSPVFSMEYFPWLPRCSGLTPPSQSLGGSFPSALPFKWCSSPGFHPPPLSLLSPYVSSTLRLEIRHPAGSAAVGSAYGTSDTVSRAEIQDPSDSHPHSPPRAQG